MFQFHLVVCKFFLGTSLLLSTYVSSGWKFGLQNLAHFFGRKLATLAAATTAFCEVQMSLGKEEEETNLFSLLQRKNSREEKIFLAFLWAKIFFFPLISAQVCSAKIFSSLNLLNVQSPLNIW